MKTHKIFLFMFANTVIKLSKSTFRAISISNTQHYDWNNINNKDLDYFLYADVFRIKKTETAWTKCLICSRDEEKWEAGGMLIERTIKRKICYNWSSCYQSCYYHVRFVIS